MSNGGSRTHVTTALHAFDVLIWICPTLLARRQQKIQQCQQAEVEADKRAQKLRGGNESAVEQGPTVTAATARPKRTPFNVNPSNPDSKAPESHYEVMTREQAAQVTHQRLAQSNTRLDEIRRSIEASRKLLAEAEAATRLLASQEEEAAATAAATAAAANSANSATKGDGSGGEVAVKVCSLPILPQFSASRTCNSPLILTST